MVYLPLSLKPQPLASFNEMSFIKLFQDDFLNNLFSVRVKAATRYNSRFTFLMQGAKNQINQEFSLSFPFNKNQFHAWLGVRNKEIKAHLDFGKVQLTEDYQFQSIFTNLKLDNLQNLIFRIGAVKEGDNYLNHLRFQVHSSGRWSIFDRLKITNYPYVTTFINEFNPLERILYRSESLFGYEKNGLEIYLRHYSNSHRNHIMNFFNFGRLHLNLISRQKDHALGVEFSIDQNKYTETSFILQKEIYGVMVKTKFDINKNLFLYQAKGKLSDFLDNFVDIDDDKLEFCIQAETNLSHQKFKLGFEFEVTL